MSRRKNLVLIAVLLFIALAGAYYVCLRILETRMAAAMDMNDRAAIVELANSFPSPVNARDKYGSTPLHWAAQSGDRALAELLLRKGAGVNAKIAAAPGWLRHAGGTPLHWGAAYGNKDVVELLIAKGANINAKDSAGKTALQWAIEEKHNDVADMLRQAGAKE